MAVKAGWEDLGNGLVRNTKVYGGVVDVNNPMYTNYQEEPQQQTEEGGGVQGTGGGSANSDGSGQAPSNPYAPPEASTTNAGSQATYRDALIKQMTENPIPGKDDEAVAAQVNPFKAAMERQRDQTIRSEAEHAFASGGQDYGAPERAVAGERAGQQAGLFESQVVGRELQARRQQIQSALLQFGNTLSGDQQRALQKQLADLDAQLKREGLNVQSTLGQGDLGLRRELGTGQLNLGLLGMLLNNQQFGDSLGLQAALGGAGLNRDALMALLQG